MTNLDCNVIRQAVSARQADFFKGLKEVMQINSVKGKPEIDAPFGAGPKQAILKALELAESLGFKTQLINNAMGYAEWGPETRDYLGVIGHLDVVPEGTGWDYDPFDLTEDNGILYGRGVLDNKGPIMSNLYALSVLKELGFVPNKTVRIVFGSDEESGSADIPMYLAVEPAPVYGYTPDCKYPAVYGERGVVGIDIVTRFSDNSATQIESFIGNFDRSSVPDTLNITLKTGEHLEIKGKRSPSNAPEMGLNTITLFAKQATVSARFNGELATYLSWLSASFHNKHDGSGIGVAFSDQESGTLQLTPYELEITKDQARLSLSIRYPISVTEEKVLSAMTEHLVPNSDLIVTRRMKSTVFDRHHPMLKTMQRVYKDCTGEDGTPVTTTGATYARSMPNILAFGPSFPGQKGIAHNKNEYMAVSDLMKNMEIYALTLAELLA
ncbi:Sapep family Mn(2+)-dependent dipeptidase [Vagococcus intermedius]|uniref:Sapep family Mn(2+)-dependent dipeptidase n=1 Tax=Vagococcus intermedius TaxID=2991418 RepID=A0AAF0CW36_9ENTE|nr:Sapep family Mn(2+)-dependent dipeptidase [Vagococcus intermedius]WEG73958.1 Sapep family Mn(2+)-dependent dipeptidase [Vagococcus intermedius]WEG76038.1 Sapep family Mn(2+)-dependent dipeptidase [Vagococcus intermedius]